MDSVLNIQVKPDWDEIEQVRLKNAAFLAEHKMPEATIDALSMVISELMENAVKYGYFDGDVKVIDASITVDADTVTVEVKSPLRQDDDAQMAKLDHMVQWIRGYQDPFQAYLVRLREVSSQNMESRESGLGLVRIVYEGQSVLDFYVDEENIVSVSAVYNIPEGNR